MIWGMQSINYPDFADRLLPFLQNFADRSHDMWTVTIFENAIIAANMQVWVANDFEAVTLTEVDDCNVYIRCCGGKNRENWQEELDDNISSWARSIGRKRVIVTARPGWAKLARKLGYKETHREFVRYL